MKYICILQQDDGTILVDDSAEPTSMEGAEQTASVDEALELVRQLLSGAPEQEDDGMEAAQAGYNKRAMKQPDAPNPMGIFGE